MSGEKYLAPTRKAFSNNQIKKQSPATISQDALTKLKILTKIGLTCTAFLLSACSILPAKKVYLEDIKQLPESGSSSGTSQFDAEDFAQLPDWVQDPYKNYSQQEYYLGVGQGETFQQAQDNAKAALSASIKAKIQNKTFTSSFVESQRGEAGETVDSRNIVQQNSRVVSRLELPEVLIVKNQQLSQESFYSLARLKKSRYKQFLLDKLELVDTKIQVEKQKLNLQQEPLQKISLLKKLSNLAKEKQEIQQLGSSLLRGFAAFKDTENFAQQLSDVQSAISLSLVFEGLSQIEEKHISQAIQDNLIQNLSGETTYNLVVSLKEKQQSQQKKRLESIAGKS